MKTVLLICFSVATFCARGGIPAPAPQVPTPPAPVREFRAAWVASVANIDWPSKAGLSVDAQKLEAIAILDHAVSLHLNAIVLQVRPACDALYQSSLEPWSEYLTGIQGQPPSPAYDPLTFWVEQAHRRGLELHAWFNPYRARQADAKSPIAENHISRAHPELVKKYGRSLWLDPGEKAVQNHSLAVLLDVVRRYDIDGVHMDDYFYPYKEKDAAGKVIEFPDDPSWRRYQYDGGALAKDDWRRDNVNRFVQRLYAEVHAAKPWVKVGISPFGIWRPGYPAQIQGFDQYDQLYADARKWLQEGWVDYFAPQLYWRIEQAPQSYPVLLQWWAEQNVQHRHLWPGLYTSRVHDGSATAWPADEVVYQVKTTRGIAGATGNIHFSMKTLLRDEGGVSGALRNAVYQAPVLAPAFPWLAGSAPARATVDVARDRSLHLAPGGAEPWLWLVQLAKGGSWTTRIVPGWERTARVDLTGVSWVALSAIDRRGVQGPAAIVPIR